MVSALALLLGVCASLLTSTTPADAVTIPGQTKLESHIGWVLETVLNAERAVHGLAPVHMSPQLQVSAHKHNLEMALHNTMSHQLPGEAYFGTRITRAGYHWSWAGENIGWNSLMSLTGVIYLEKAMYNEKPPDDGHRLNILSRHFRNVGIDVYFDKKHRKVWLTTDFASH